MKLIRKAAFVFGAALTVVPAWAIAETIKGVKIGEVQTESELERVLPGIKCEPNPAWRLSICTANTTFWGHPAEALVWRNLQGQVQRVVFYLTTIDYQAAVTAMRKLHGEPSNIYPSDMVPNAPPQTRWDSINGTTKFAFVNKEPELHVGFGDRGVSYAELDMSDM